MTTFFTREVPECKTWNNGFKIKKQILNVRRKMM